MASTRADEVAELLWELKRAGKVSTFTEVARQAGFSAGANGRAMESCMRVVRRGWPHLEWWRILRDNGLLQLGEDQTFEDQKKQLEAAGFVVEMDAKGKNAVVAGYAEYLMAWPNPAVEATS
jgi:alkylated DNA nucleotide flippase Atl1